MESDDFRPPEAKLLVAMTVGGEPLAGIVVHHWSEPLFVEQFLDHHAWDMEELRLEPWRDGGPMGGLWIWEGRLAWECTSPTDEWETFGVGVWRKPSPEELAEVAGWEQPHGE